MGRKRRAAAHKAGLPASPAQQAAIRRRLEVDLGQHLATFEHWKADRWDASFVYLVTEWNIEGQRTGFVKIGLAKDPAKRVRQLRSGNPRHLQCDGLILGWATTERLMHKRWAHFSRHTRTREWFAGGCMDYIRWCFQEIAEQQQDVPLVSSPAAYDQVVQRVNSRDFTDAQIIEEPIEVPSDGDM